MTKIGGPISLDGPGKDSHFWSDDGTAAGVLTPINPAGSLFAAETNLASVRYWRNPNGEILPTGSGGTPAPSPSPVATSSFAMTQLAGDSQFFYQRSTTSGGSAGKGYGTVRVTVAPTVAGTVYARVRRAIDDAVVQPAFLLGPVTLGSTYVDVQVDARIEMVYVDLLDSSGTWKLGTRGIQVGHIMAVYDVQSHGVKFFVKDQNTAGTIQELGLTVHPNGWTFVRMESSAGDPNSSQLTATWRVPDAVGALSDKVNSPGVCSWLNGKIAELGVAVAAVGLGIGGTTFMYWGSNAAQTATSGILAVCNGGWAETLNWMGASDAQGNTPTPGLTKGWRDSSRDFYQALNTCPLPVKRNIVTIPNWNNTGQNGTFHSRWTGRKADKLWAEGSPNTILFTPMDLRLYDNVHPRGEGSLRLSYHLLRGANNKGPEVTAAVRTGATILCTVTHTPGANDLVFEGDPTSWFRVISRAPAAGRSLSSKFTVSSVTRVNATQFLITLSTDPGDGHALRIYTHGEEISTSQYALQIRDNYSDGAGIGRHLFPSPTGIEVAAPSPGGTINAPPTGYVAMNASICPATITNPAFNTAPTSGRSQLAGAAGNTRANAGSFAIPYRTMTLEFFLTMPAAYQNVVAGLVTYFTSGNWIGLSTANRPQVQGFATAASWTPQVGKEYWFCDVSDAAAGTRRLYVRNITDNIDEGIILSSTTPLLLTQAATLNIMHINNNSYFTGGIHDVALWDYARYSDGSRVPPAMPYTGDEPGLLRYYPLQDSGRELVGEY